MAVSTQITYQSLFRKHLQPLFDKRMAAFTSADLQALMNDKRGYSRSTLDNIKSVLYNVFTQAYSDGIIDRNIALSIKKPKAKPAEKRRALADTEKDIILSLPNTHPLYLLVMLLYYTGARLGEVCALRWSDLDFKGREIYIERDLDFRLNDIGEVKSDNSVRTIPIPDKLYNILYPIRGIGYIVTDTKGNLWGNTSLHRAWVGLAAYISPSLPHTLCAVGFVPIASRWWLEARENRTVNRRQTKKDTVWCPFSLSKNPVLKRKRG